jgi:ABC-type molybdate transport system permease subunit
VSSSVSRAFGEGGEVLTCWSRLPENTQTIKTNTAPLNKAFRAINGKRLAFRGGGLFAWG